MGGLAEPPLALEGLKLNSRINTGGGGATEYMTQNKFHVFSTIKCIEVSEVALTIYIAHLFITP